MSLLAPGSITDVAGLLAGHAAVAGRPSGCSVVLCPQGAVCGAAVRGGAPGTRETDLLRPENTVERVHAVLLAGGSAFGLDAAGGVMRWLEEHGHGYEVQPRTATGSPGRSIRIPIVPAAVLFDLWLGDSSLRPDAATGYAACLAASTEAPRQGNVGVGLGATVGKAFGIGRAMRGGVGSASWKCGPFTVAALVAVNAIGDVLDEQGRPLAGARSEDGRTLVDTTRTVLAGAGTAHGAGGTATTIGVVATDAVLCKAQATQLASLAHHGLARCVSPLTVNDGDAFFALATGVAGPGAELNLLGVMAASVVAAAIRNAVRCAHSLSEPWLPAATELG